MSNALTVLPHLHQLLPDILPLQHPDERPGRIFQPVDHILAIDQALLLQPRGELPQSVFEPGANVGWVLLPCLYFHQVLRTRR